MSGRTECVTNEKSCPNDPYMMFQMYREIFTSVFFPQLQKDMHLGGPDDSATESRRVT